MSAEKHKAFMHRFIEAGNQQDMAAVWESIDPQADLPGIAKLGVAPTFAGYQQFLAAFYTALPDAILHVDEMVADGEQVCVWYTITGTQRGPFRGIPPTNQQVSYRFIALYRIAHNKIVYVDLLADEVRLLRQLGAFPA